ncbi:universal stress protein [Desulfococcaceae bacterium HSG7]|nr:universal stress protein [Desulfococcaceae bacterium HSG7]
MKFEKILFHTRFRELAFSSLETILELKDAGLKEVVLIYIVPREEVSFVPYGGYNKEEEERLKETTRIRFEDWQEAIEQKGIKSKIRIEVGMTNSKILSVAEEENVQLIVTGRKKRSAFEKVYVGSHILDLLRRSQFPVLMSKYMAQYELLGDSYTKVNDHIYKRPMLATDWSDASANALQAMLGFKNVAEKIMVTHVIGAKISKGIGSDHLKDLEEESEKRLRAYSETAAKAGVEVETHLSCGKTAAEILRLSREHKATMIVMGRTGKDWFQQYWLGGVSHRVAEMSELPVLLVP